MARGSGPLASAVVLLVASLLTASPLNGQAKLAGQLAAEGTDRPVSDAFVSLRGQDGERVDATLSDDAGRFVLEADEPGPYRVRVQRMGFAAWRSGSLRLEKGQQLRRTFRVPVQPVRLDDLSVTAQSECDLDPGESSQLREIWDAVRQGLEVAAWSEERFRFDLTNHCRLLDPSGTLRRTLGSWSTSAVRGPPYRTAKATSLLKDGFIRERRDTVVFFAPTPSTLLHPEFRAAYCFSVRRDSAGNPGLHFHPAEGASNSGVRGTLWLSGSPPRLNVLRYRYMGLPVDVTQEHLGGRLEFERLQDGGWIVRSWWIRMPRAEQSTFAAPSPLFRRARPETRTRLRAIVERGGRLRSVRAPSGERIGGSGATVQGTVIDSLRGGRAAGATVEVPGTGRELVVDSSGRFSFQGLQEGTHSIRVHHPLSGILGLDPVERRIVIRPGRTYRMSLLFPSLSSVAERLCMNSVPEPELLVAGRVLGPGGGSVDRARVTAVRSDIELRGNRAAPRAGRTYERRSVRTDSSGVYRLCLPSTGRTTLWVSAAGAGDVQQEIVVEPERNVKVVDFRLRSGSTEETVDDRAVSAEQDSAALSADQLAGRIDTIGRGTPSSSRIIGRLLDETTGAHANLPFPQKVVFPAPPSLAVAPDGSDSGETRIVGKIMGRDSERPIEAMEVVELSSDRRAVTDPEGRFVLDGVGGGERRLRLHHVGYGTDTVTVEVPARQMLSLALSLRPRPVKIEPLSVRVEGREVRLDYLEDYGFYRRRERGWGEFWGPDEIRNWPGVRVTQFLERTPQVRMMRDPINKRRIIPKMRALPSCGPPLAVVDGHQWGNTPADWRDLYRSLPGTEVAAIEVSRNPAETAPEYVSSRSRCGVVVIWTRRGPR